LRGKKAPSSRRRKQKRVVIGLRENKAIRRWVSGRKSTLGGKNWGGKERGYKTKTMVYLIV